jgi:hypothetical protein
VLASFLYGRDGSNLCRLATLVVTARLEMGQFFPASGPFVSIVLIGKTTRIKRRTDRTLLIGEYVDGYQSIALETLYNFGFGSVSIGRTVGSQMKENGA